MMAEPVWNSIEYDFEDTSEVISSAYFASIALPCINSGWLAITLFRKKICQPPFRKVVNVGMMDGYIFTIKLPNVLYTAL
jgi:hypothetical protein